MSPQPFAARAFAADRPASGHGAGWFRASRLSSRRLVPAFVLGLALLAPAERAWAICQPQEGQRLSLDAANRFKLNPAPLLRQQMSRYSLSVFIMHYAAEYSRDLDTLKLLLAKADKNQQVAIGLGLARAVTVCRVADGSIADRVDKWASRLPMHNVLDAYRQTMMQDDTSAGPQTTQLTPPALEDRFGSGLDLIHPPSADGAGGVDIPDPTALPGD